MAPTPLVALGHSHRPFAFLATSSRWMEGSGLSGGAQLDDGGTVLWSGAVAADPGKACFMVVDLDLRHATWHRLRRLGGRPRRTRCRPGD